MSRPLLFEKLRADRGGSVNGRDWDLGLGRSGRQHNKKAGALTRRLRHSVPERLPVSWFELFGFIKGGHHRHKSTIVFEKLQLEQVNKGRS